MFNWIYIGAIWWPVYPLNSVLAEPLLCGLMDINLRIILLEMPSSVVMR